MTFFVFLLILIATVDIMLNAILSKVYAKRVEHNPNAIWLCITITAIFACFFFTVTGLKTLTFDSSLLIYSLIYAALIEAAFVLNIIALKISDITLVLIFRSVGAIAIPAAVGFALGESITPSIIIGLSLLIAATVIPCISGEMKKTKAGVFAIIINSLNLLFQGASSAFGKFIAINPHIDKNAPSLFLWTNVVMLVISLACLAFFATKTKKNCILSLSEGGTDDIKAKNVPIFSGFSAFVVFIILLMAFSSNSGSYIEIYTLKFIGISELSMVRSSLTLILSYIPSIFIFKEKPTKQEIVSTIVCIVGLIVYFI